MLVFVHINKTAGSTVRYILRSSYGVRHCEVEPWHAQWADPPFSSDDLPRLRKVYPQLESIAGHRVTGYVDLHEKGTKFDYFTFMRDPIKTCASRFQYNVQYRKKKGLVFEEWIQKDWTRNSQTKLIAGVPDVDKAIRIIKDKNIFVGLVEHFDESMLMLKELRAKSLNISYRRVNIASSNNLAKKLLSNESTRKMLIEANQVDQELYDFIRQKLYPAYQSEYGPSLMEDVVQYQQKKENDFNSWNLTVSRLKQYAIYKPLLYVYRRMTRSQSRLGYS